MCRAFGKRPVQTCFRLSMEVSDTNSIAPSKQEHLLPVKPIPYEYHLGIVALNATHDMIAGVDYVTVRATDYRVKSLNGWSIKSGNRVGEVLDSFGNTSDGQQMIGSGYYLNTETARIDLSPFGLKVDFNPSTLQHPFNLITDRAELANSAEVVESKLAEVGLEFDFFGAHLKRLDLAKQHPINGSTPSLTDVWSTLHGTRMKQRNTYPDGFRMGNTQRQVIFYDKTKQLREAKRLTVDTPEDLVRCEIRWTKSNSIGSTRSGAGVGTLGQLIDTEPEALTESYNQFLLKQVFRTPDGWQASLDFDTEVDVIRAFRSEHQRGAIDRYIKLEGIEAIVQRFGGLELFGIALARAGYERSTVHRKLADLRKGIEQKGFLDTRRGEQTTASKIDHLRAVFCA